MDKEEEAKEPGKEEEPDKEEEAEEPKKEEKPDKEEESPSGPSGTILLGTLENDKTVEKETVKTSNKTENRKVMRIKTN